MSEATDRAKKLRAELAAAEKTVKMERDAERAAERARQRAEDIAATDAYRDENYEVVAGSHSDWVGVSSGWNGGVDLTIHEWSTPQSSTSLTRDDVLALIAGLQELVK